VSAYDVIIDALRAGGCRVIERGAGHASAQCPVTGHGQGNGDLHPSLSIYPRKDGNGMRVCCQAGCPDTEVLAALGLTVRDLFDEPKIRNALNPNTSYRYPNGDTKQRRGTGKDKKMTWAKKGQNGGGLLYGVETLTAADQTVYLHEGESAAKALRAMGCAAVSTGGAERRCDMTPLRGRDVIAVVDRDQSGLKWAHRIRAELSGAASLQFVQAAVNADRADAVDHVAADLSLAELVPLQLDDSDEDDVPGKSWAPINLAPYLAGEIKPLPPPSVGIHRDDGQQLLYAACEHAVVGPTESAKTWLALACVKAELDAGHRVLYIHYEEPGPESTIERLRMLGVTNQQMLDLLVFVAPHEAIRKERREVLLTPPPSLVIHDGVNEAMSLHADEIEKAGGAAAFRRRLIVPFLRVGAATLACDHVPINTDPSRRDAYGSVHKGNVLTGARIGLENVEPFGRGLRGVSKVFVTKDRPGYLRAAGRPDNGGAGKTFVGMLVGDDSDPYRPFSLMFYGPKEKPEPGEDPQPDNPLLDQIWEVVYAQPDHRVGSERRLFAALRDAKIKFTNTAAKDAIDDLALKGRLIEVLGKNRSKGYEAVLSASDEAPA
jgi:hypothetical protein